MPISEAEKRLLSLLNSGVATPIKEIAQKLYVSESTARRYVNALARRNLVIRTHGGCLPSQTILDQNTPMYIRFSSEQKDKQRIAQKAASLISSGATIFLDSSSTAFHMIPYLRAVENLTVVTSGLKTAMALTELNVKTVSLGGEISAGNLSANSAFAIQSVKQFNADVFFFSSDALSDTGEITDNSYEECLLRKELMKYARICVFMIDPTKMGKKCKYNLCSLHEVDYCITVKENEAVFL